MTDYAQFKVGPTIYPLGVQTAGASLLDTCDPTISNLRAFFAFAIRNYLATALTDATAGGEAPIANTIETLLSVDPMAVAKVDQFKFPLFALWRKRSTYDNKTTNWRHEVARLGCAYILPPLTAAQAIKFQPVLTSVSHILMHMLHQGFDPGFRDGERVIFANDIERARLVSAEYARFEFGDTMDFHAWIGELEIAERETPYTGGLSTLTGVGITITDGNVEPDNPIEIEQLSTENNVL